MELLLDTHILYWFLGNDARLSARARKLIEDRENIKYFSIISAWETAIKHLKHPNLITFSGTEFIKMCMEAQLRFLPITDRCIPALESLSRPADAPRRLDPFDRMLIARAKSEGMRFLTHDALLSGYHEDCVTLV